MRGRLLVKIERGGFGYMGTEALGKDCGIIGVNVSVLGRARNGDVGKSGVEEFGERIRVMLTRTPLSVKDCELWLVTAEP